MCGNFAKIGRAAGIQIRSNSVYYENCQLLGPRDFFRKFAQIPKATQGPKHFQTSILLKTFWISSTNWKYFSCFLLASTSSHFIAFSRSIRNSSRSSCVICEIDIVRKAGMDLLKGDAPSDTRKVKVLSLPETIKEKSTFRAKALRRELVVGGGGRAKFGNETHFMYFAAIIATRNGTEMAFGIDERLVTFNAHLLCLTHSLIDSPSFLFFSPFCSVYLSLCLVLYYAIRLCNFFVYTLFWWNPSNWLLFCHMMFLY